MEPLKTTTIKLKVLDYLVHNEYQEYYYKLMGIHNKHLNTDLKVQNSILPIVSEKSFRLFNYSKIKISK